MRHGSCYLRGLAILLLGICFAETPLCAAVTIDTTTLVRAYLESQLSDLNGREIEHPNLVKLYANRNYQPLWTNETSSTPEAHQLLERITASSSHGLNPEVYQLSEIRKRFQSSEVVARAELDLLLTRALQDYNEDLQIGTLIPRDVDPRWFVGQKYDSILSKLERALAENFFTDLLNSIEPRYPGYNNLRSALARYQTLWGKGGWPRIELQGDSLKLGHRHPVVALLRIRLALTEDYRRPFIVSEIFDNDLADAIRHFQKRHGLKVDGRVGPATLAAMNIPVSERIQQILVNMERWRWEPTQLEARHILVNMASFTMEVVEDQQAAISMKVIVGKPDRSTPAFSQAMTHMILNPYWNVPRSIAIRDILPRIRRDPTYLDSQQFHLFRSDDEQTVEIDPTRIDWNDLDTNNFPYLLRQDPGPHNALGRIKFIIPNKFSIYLHDTPQRHLFQKEVRSFSSGCVRLEKPLELARYLLNYEQGWDKEKIMGLLGSQHRKVVKLQKPVPVHIVYRTVWVNQGNVLNFRKDVYDRNALLRKAFLDYPSST
jgi:murein L,D-transpeptidase YcbB/YkuD